MPLRIRRGVEADRTGFTPLEGEPIYVTDTKKVYIGDGATAGGVQVTAKSLTIDTQDFTASGTWTKPANAVWVEVTMCGAGESGGNGTNGAPGYAGNAGRIAQKTFIASALTSTVSVTCGASDAFATPSTGSRSSFGAYVYAAGGTSGLLNGGSTPEIYAVLNMTGSEGAAVFGASHADYGGSGCHGAPMGPGAGGGGADTGAGGEGGLAASGKTDATNSVERGGGGAGGASGTTGVAGTAGGYDTITGFGHGGGGGGEGTAGAGGAGGAAVRGGGGGGGGKGTTTGGAGGAGGAGFVRVRTLCFG